MQGLHLLILRVDGLLLSMIKHPSIVSRLICHAPRLSWARSCPGSRLAVGKKVKNLVLDFKHPNWRNFSDVTFQEQYKLVFEIPESVYSLTTLESLKVYACKNFEPWRFSNPGILKTLSLGWMRLPNLESFLSVSSSLLSLSINDCWAHNVMKIVGNIRELAIENCKFPVIPCSFRLPRVEIFRYSGVLCCLQFNTINANIKEVYLDFGAMGNHHRLRDSDIEKSIVPCYILNGLRSIRTLTVCHYLLQVIKTTDHWLNPVKTQHLVLKTKLHPREFDGIRFLLNNCPDLEMLIFDLFPANSIEMASSCAGIDPQTYWMQNITYNCMRKTLKVVVVKNFLGGLNELNVVKYLIGSGREPDIVLERVELHMPYGLDESQKMFAYAGIGMLQQRSKHFQILVYNS